MNDDKKILSARGLGKSFGGRKVLASLDLEAAEGEVVGILGRNEPARPRCSKYCWT